MESVIPEAQKNEISFNDIYDDGSNIEYSSIPDGYISPAPSLSELGDLETPALSREDYVRSVLSQFEKIAPDTTDSYSGDEICI